MGAPVRRLRHRVWHWPFSGFLRGRDPAPEPQEALDEFALDKIAVTFKQYEDDRAPTAGEIDAKERERADRFKRNLLLPVMGIAGLTGITGPS
jgi:hypothetical protein